MICLQKVYSEMIITALDRMYSNYSDHHAHASEFALHDMYNSYYVTSTSEKRKYASPSNSPPAGTLHPNAAVSVCPIPNEESM